MTLTPQDFVERWGKSALREQQAAQSHFNELCRLVGHAAPTQLDPEGRFFTFEEQVEKATGGRGRADVWYAGHFAWEYKGKHKDLDAAYAQIQSYRGGLDNPPLLVVCDFDEFRIYPQWVNMSGKPILFHNDDLTDPLTLRFIQWLLTDPDAFKGYLDEELKRRERVTEDLAMRFAELARRMREHAPPEGPWGGMRIARFLTKLVFTLFVEDVGLLPTFDGVSTLSYILANAGSEGVFAEAVRKLFSAMDGRTPRFVFKPIPYFNGGLFADSASDSEPGGGDGLDILDLTPIPPAVDILKQCSERDWRHVSPTIFGTLFERALDESKRAQLGAHYTGEKDIRLVVEPVLMQPLNRRWDAVRAEAEPLMQTYLNAAAPRDREAARARLIALHDAMMAALEGTTVLDPACGSGNFLYVALRLMKDLERSVRRFFAPLALPFRDVVTPRQFYGIEKDEFAARLAHVAVWIGYLQWRYEDEGVLRVSSGRGGDDPHALPHPILRDKLTPDEPDRIVCADAILRYDAEGNPYEPEWQPVDVIIGNPPFLGGKRLRSELGDAYLDDVFALYDQRVPHEADLVCYWYEKARAKIAAGTAKRAGLLATNSIRGGANRVVLDRIKQTGDIFMAWGDRPWVLNGAAVRISIVGFDNRTESRRILDGAPVNQINADLQNSIDATQARRLTENLNIAFMGDTKGGAFDIPDDLAQKMLAMPNSSGRDNRDVLRPWVNGRDIVDRPRGMWIIDFGTDMPIEEARLYEAPFQHVEEHVFPERQKNRRDTYRERWWIHVEARPGMRRRLEVQSNYIVTPSVAKHRIFAWLESGVIPDHQLHVFAREDDYFFGVLHSTLHEKWSLRLGTSLEDRPRYTPSTTFETFPFPYSPGKEPTDAPAHQAISAAARALHEERDAWLNPPEWESMAAGSSSYRDRTLTNLYNALEWLRAGGENGGGRIPDAARRFAPRLAALHDALDRAVLAAYGWDDLADRLRTPDGEEEMLRRLLALNLERAGSGAGR